VATVRPNWRGPDDERGDFVLVSTSVAFRGFWAYHGADVRLRSIQFLKNLSIGSGLLAIFLPGPGGISVDARHARKEGDHP
jgi:uncharacterized membrane protein YphA (DoxX/SURF4 family)